MRFIAALVVFILALAPAYAAVSHPISEVTPADSNLNLGAFNISASHVIADGEDLRSLIDATGNLTGSGNANYIPRFSGSSSLINSLVYDTGTRIGIGTTSPTQPLTVIGALNATSFIGDGSQLFNLNVTGIAEQYNYVWNGSDFVGMKGTPEGVLQAEITAIDAVGGSGTANYLAKFSASETLADSVIYDDGTNVGIGTTSPGGLFHLNSSSDPYLIIERATNPRKWRFSIEGNNGRLNIQDSTAEEDRLVIDENGYVGIGTTSPDTKLDVEGNVTLSGDVPRIVLYTGDPENYYLGRDGTTITLESAGALSLNSLTGTVSLNNGRITSLADPNGNAQAATVDGNLIVKQAIRSVTPVAQTDGNTLYMDNTNNLLRWRDGSTNEHFVVSSDSSSETRIASGTDTENAITRSFSTGLSSIDAVTITTIGNGAPATIESISGGTVNYYVNAVGSGSTGAVSGEYTVHWIAVGS